MRTSCNKSKSKKRVNKNIHTDPGLGPLSEKCVEAETGSAMNEDATGVATNRQAQTKLRNKSVKWKLCSEILRRQSARPKKRKEMIALCWSTEFH